VLTPFPVDFPFDAVSILISDIRIGSLVDKVNTLRAAYTVVGYALGQLVKTPTVMAQTAPITDEGTLANYLENLTSSHKEGTQALSFSDVDWQSVLSVLLPLVLKWLSK
jgi:hypothetical protein